MGQIDYLQGRLSKLESHLQRLVESPLARLFASQRFSPELSSLLFAAMKSNIVVDAQGNFLAPHRFTLLVHPTEAQSLNDDLGMLEELAAEIRAAGTQAGFCFLEVPTIRVLAHPEIAPRQISILAEISPHAAGKTATMEVEAAPPTESIPPNAFLMVEGMRLVRLEQAVVNIGRRPDNHLVIQDGRVSRLHAQLRAIHGTYVIFDLESTGGTFVNGQRVKEHKLQAGDVISLAGVQIIYGQESLSSSDGDQGATRPFEP